MDEQKQARYRIKSIDLLEQLLFVVEEPGVRGEYRLPVQKLFECPKLLYQFNKKDIQRITYASSICSKLRCQCD